MKGCGFIQPDGAADNSWVHYWAIVIEGFRSHGEGKRIPCAVKDASKGREALSVVQPGPERTS